MIKVGIGPRDHSGLRKPNETRRREGPQAWLFVSCNACLHPADWVLSVPVVPRRKFDTKVTPVAESQIKEQVGQPVFSPCTPVLVGERISDGGDRRDGNP